MFTSSKWEEGKSDKGLGEQVYSGAAEFGLFWANIAVVIGTIVALGLIYWGIVLWRQKEKYSVSIQGKITDAQCASASDGKRQYQQCAIKIEYVVDGKPYNFETIRSDQYYAKGYNISLRYNPDNPVEATLDPPVKTFGQVMILVALVILAGVWINWYVKRRFKFAAAAGGVGAAVDMFRGGSDLIRF
jgi:hypothetical protein